LEGGTFVCDSEYAHNGNGLELALLWLAILLVWLSGTVIYFQLLKVCKYKAIMQL
jgi:hypothetical protein